MTIHERIYRLRKEKGLSQEQLAEALHISRQAVSKWESQQSTPDIDNIILLSDYFHVTTDYLLTGKNTTTHVSLFNAKTSIILSTTLNTLGLFLSIIIFHATHSILSLIAFIICTTLSILLHQISIQLFHITKQQQYHFWKINIWLVSFTPFSIYLSSLTGVDLFLPIFYGYDFSLFVFYILLWFIYVLCCYWILRKIKRKMVQNTL
ncbi:helix-turn-helix domain-containing protein [Granulicatella sp. zg-ZJ]|uniref:helix-turn-helix domain-containing protein n=1 Tax=Granulicatella sp. zg-ZJ TaxID=2678504 RepID=UPI0013D090F1|nr:helix-turn-helix transcriptional regulator [Granulicatella sp. zg-ZJ]MBS4750152.1 helix-turn-helix transcriptional regulator [Carnobacteriaceae bacterium zg-ZUI78]NEW62355.1 helix-turn-helix domain-containing protein [Granulicatella sp. zg-ZJ]